MANQFNTFFCCLEIGNSTEAAAVMSSGDFCDVVMKCLVIVLQTNFPTGTNKVPIYLS